MGDKLPRKLFGTNGVRGVVNKDLSPALVYWLSRAIGTYFRGKEILVGGDIRLGTKMISKYVISALIESGVDVYLSSSPAPTPAHQYAVKHYGLDGGVIITASHNPPQFDGIKLLTTDGNEIPHEEEEVVEEIFFTKSFEKGRGKIAGHIDPIKHYVNAIINHLDIEAIKSKNHFVIIDPGSSVAALTVPKVLERLDVRYLIVNGQLDGAFPSRSPEPLPTNLIELGKYVRKLKASLAVAYDGDADRSIFIDEKGRVIWGDRSGAMLSEYVIEKHGKGTLVVGVSASRVVEHAVKRVGGKIIWTKVGSVIITHKILELLKKGEFAFGLEENGGFFYTPHQPTRDGTMTTALMLEAISKMNITLGKYNDSLPSLYMLKDKIPCPNYLKPKLMEKVIDKYSKLGYNYDTIDGIRVWLDENKWFMIRPSGTEPIIRIFAEAENIDIVKGLLKKIRREVEELLAKLS